MNSSTDPRSLQPNEFDSLNPLNVDAQDGLSITRPNHPSSSSPVEPFVIPETQEGLDTDPLQDLTLGDWVTQVDRSTNTESGSSVETVGDASETDPLLGTSGEMLTGSPNGLLSGAGTNSGNLAGIATGTITLPKQIIFVDSSVADDDELLAGLTFQAEIIRLDGTRDGVAQISEALALRQGVSSIHIITHGSEGSLQLGNTVLDSETLATYQSALQGWASSLTGDADILIYGCDVAGNAEGKAFVDQMSQWTGADVAASDDLTGNVALGGDWQLEYSTGSIEAPTFSSTTYQGVLPSAVLTESGKLIYSSSNSRGEHSLFISIESGSLIIEDKMYSSLASNNIDAGNGVSQVNNRRVSVSLASVTALEVNTGDTADIINFEDDDGLTFSNAVDISINTGGGDDVIKLVNSVNTKGGDFSIRGQDGDRDNIIVSGVVQTDGGNVDFRADKIQTNTNSRIATLGGDIYFEGDNIDVNGNAVLSTRSIDPDATEPSDSDSTTQWNLDEDAGSTGDSGDISFIGQRIRVGEEGKTTIAKLLAHVEESSSYSAGDITLKASEEEQIANVIDGLETSISKVELFGATVKGYDVTLKATSEYDNTFNDGGSVKDVFLSIASFVDNFSIVGGAAVSQSKAFVTIDDGSNITAGSLDASATATTDAVIQPLLSWFVGAAYAKADSTAVVSVGGNITTTGDVSISTSTDSTVDAQVSAAPASEDNPYGNAASAVAVSELKSNSTAEVTDTATIDAGGSVDVTAKTIDHNVTSATSGVKADGSAALAAAVSFEDGQTRALVDGAVTAAGDITVDAQQKNRNTQGLLNGGQSLLAGSGVQANAGISDVDSSLSGSAIGSITAVPGQLNALVDAIRNKKGQDSTDQDSPIKLSAATAYVDDKNDVVARIGRNTTDSTDPTIVESTGGSININATVESRPNVSAGSSIDEQEEQEDLSTAPGSESDSSNNDGTTVSGSVGLAIGNYTNTAEAYINDYAEVDAKNDLSITSQTLNDYVFLLGFNLVEPFQGDGNLGEQLGGFVPNLVGYLDDNLGLNNYVFDSWSQSTATNGSTLAVAGAATVLEMNQTSKAFIGENAKVNQDEDLRSDSQAVVVDAKNVNESVHFGGNIQFPGVSWSKGITLQSSLNSGGVGTEGDGAVGGTVLVLDYINDTSAKVKAGADLYADSLAVTADSTTMNVAVGAAGGEAETFGFSGVGSWVSVDNTTTANIAGGATVVIGDNGVDGASSKSLVVEATDTTDSINLLGGVTSSQSIGVGATIGFNTINRKTRAVIGNLTDNDSTTKTSLTSAGDIKVRADNNGWMGSFSLAAAKTAPESNEEQTGSQQSPSYGVGISGDASVNEISDVTEAYLRHVNLNLTQASELGVTAQNSSNILAIGGAASLSMGDATQETQTTVGVAGSYGQNTIQQETKAYLQTVQQQSDSATLSDVSVEAENKSRIFALNAGLAGAVGAATSELNIAIAGAVTLNEVDNKTKAYIRGSSLTNLTSTSIDALDNSKIHSNAGGAALAFAIGTRNSNTSASAGVGLAINDVTNDVSAFVENSTLTAGGDVSVNAESKSTVEAFALGAAASVSSSASNNGISLAGAGAGTKNEINNTIQAYLSNGSSVTTTGSGTLDVTATDESTIVADSGGFSFAFASGQNATAASVGASVAENEIHNTIKAEVEDSTVTAAGAVTIAAESKAKIDALSISGSLAVASGTSNGIALAGAGAGTTNQIDNNIKARVQGSTITTSNAAQLEVTAKDQSKIKADAGGVAIAAGAVGASIASNQIGKNQGHSIQALIDDSMVTATGDVIVEATSESTIESLALGAAVGASGAASGNAVSLAGAGAGTENEIKATIWAELSNDSEVTTTGTGALSITATDASQIKADSGGFSLALAGASNGAAAASVGVSVAENKIQNTVEAEVDNATVTAAGAVTVTASSTATIDALSMSGAASGSAGNSGSLALSGAGAGTTNQIDNNIKAGLTGSTIETSNAANVDVTATDQSTITADAGGVAIAAALSGDAGMALSVGASIANNQIGKTQGHSIQALIEDSTVTAAGDVNLTATSTATIKGQAFAGAAALGASANGAGLAFAGAGTGIDNQIQATIAAAIQNNSDVTATGDITLKAEDTSQIAADAGAGALSLGGGQGGIAASVGVAIADNTIGNTVRATIQGSEVTANALTLDANSEATINTFGLAGAIALSAGSSGALSLAGSGTAATNNLNNTIQAFISDSSTVTTTADLNQTATDNSTIESLAVGGSIALAGGGFSGAIAIGAVTVENTINNKIQAFIVDLSDDATEVTVGGDLNLKAESLLTLTENTAVAASFAGSGGKGFAFSGAGAEVITTTTNVVEAFIQNVGTTSGSDRNINVTGNLSLNAIDTATVKARVGSGAAVAGLIGASVGVSTAETTIDNQVRAYIDDSRVKATGDVDVKAQSTPDVDVKSVATSVAASIGGAGAGAEALGTVKSTVEARIGSASEVTGADISVAADSDDTVTATANGSGAGLVATGASVAKAKANSNTQANVSNATVTATNLDITANTESDVDAEATAAGGAAVVSTASSSDAVNESNVKATVGAGSVLEATETLKVTAKSDSDQDAKADGYNGGLLAAGANMAKASADLTTEALLETGVNITAADLTITAAGQDDNFANSIAGGGGLVSGQAATSVTDSKSRSSVRIEDGDSTADNVEIDVTGVLEITADQTTTFNGKADSVNASVVGGSGASVTNTVATDATVEIGVDTDNTQQDLAIEAGSLTVNASQTIEKAELSDQTAEAASGGAIDGSAVVSKTTIENRTEITIGDSLASNGFGTEIATTGDMLLNAFNDVSAWDEVKLDSGGLISAAIAESKLLNRVNDATITIQDAELESDQAITLSALANVDLDTTANASSYGLAGLPMGITQATSDTRNRIQLLDGASLRTEGDVNLLAGQAADGSTNQLDVNARSNIWNNSAAPLVAPGSSEASIKLENTINVADGAEVESVRDANLIAVDGTVSSEAVRKSQDLYSKTAGAITGASTANIKTKRDDITNNSGITVDGSVTVSIDNKETLTIAEAIDLNNPTTVDGATVYPINITEQTDGIGDLTLTVEDLSNNIQTTILQLQELKTTYAGDSNAVAAYQAEINFLNRQLTELGDVSQAAYINVPDITVKTGDIRVIGDYLQGSGDLNSPGDAEIKITNHSPYYLRVNDLIVPEVQGGRILFNSALVTDNDSISDRNTGDHQATFGAVITAENSDEAIIAVENTYDPTFAQQASALSNLGAPDVEAIGSVDNFKGTVRLANNEGSVLVSGNLNAKTVDIDSGSDFVLNNQGAAQNGDQGRVLEFDPERVNQHNNIFYISEHGFTTGDRVLYSNGEGASIGGLNDARVYFVQVHDSIKFKLFADADFKTLINIEDEGQNDGSTHSLTVQDDKNKVLKFAPERVNQYNNTFYISGHGFATGDRVSYSPGGGASIGGVTEARSYFVQVHDATKFKLFADAEFKTLINIEDEGQNDGSIHSFSLNYDQGFFHVGGDPRSQLASLSRASETGSSTSRTASPGLSSTSSITASNNVFVSARYLNINGLIQSGTPDRNVNLGSDLNDDISAFKTAYENDPTGSKYLTLSTDEDGSIEARYNAETNRIELDDVEVQGGYMQLVGNIISTGNGKLEVLDGFGRIGVTNRTNYELVVNRLDTGGNGIEGQLQIIDTAKTGSNGEALTTTYTRLGNNITKTDTSGNTTTLNNTRNASYDPSSNQRYNWVTGQASLTETVKLYKDRSKFGIDGLLGDKNLESETVTLLDEVPLLEGVFVETRNSAAAYDYSRETVTLSAAELVSREKWKETKGFLNTKTVHYQKDTYQTGEKTFNTHSYQADSRINIEFIGYDTGSVSIDSTQNVFLVDSIENQGGTTTLNSHNSKLTHLSTIGAVVSDRLLLNNHTITDLRTDVNELQFTTKGKATITDIQGDVTISGASAAFFSPVELSVEGSLLGSGSGAYDLRGSQVSVTSRNGSIGADDQALRVNSAITNHSTWSPAGFNGWAGLKLEAAQDININETEGDLYLVSAKAGGDVTLGALAGSVFDNNNAETIDPYSQQQLDELWESMQLTTDRSGQAIASFKQQATQLYETYWNYRNATTTVDGGYTADAYDANFAYQYSDAARSDLLDRGYSEASITKLEAEKTQEYHTLHTLFSGGSVNLPEGQAHLATVIEDIFRDSDFSGKNLTDLSNYDPGLVEQQYQVSNQQQDALSQGSQWTQAELKNTMRSGTFGSTADTQYTVEDANITAGGDVTVTASGSIGHTAGTLTIDNWGSKDWSDLSSQEQLALSYAERDDLTYFDAAGNVIENPEQSSAAIASIEISLKQDLDIDAAGEINLTASQHIFLGSEQDINLDQVQAGSTVRIKAAEGVYDVAAENTVNITSGDLVLEAGNASIGSRQAAITVDLDDSQEAGLTARAEDEIHIDNVQGKLKIEGAYSGEGATFSSVDDIEVETNRLAGGPVNLRGDNSDNHIELIADSTELPVDLVVDGGTGQDQVVVTPVGEEIASNLPESAVDAIAHWSLSETTGTAAVNEGSLGAAVSATYVGNPNLDVDGLVANSDGAVYFDGINDGINLTSHADINLSSQAQRSVELWFKADDLDGKQVIYEEGGTLNGVNLYLEGDRLNFGIWANRKGQWLEHSVKANKIYHAVLVFDQGQLTAYVNGEAVGQVATGFSALPPHGDPAGIAQVHGGTLFAGNTVDSSSSHRFQGMIDDFSLYNDGLSADAIAQRYSVGQQPVAHWSLSETTGNRAVNQGTLDSEIWGTYVGSPNLEAEGLVANRDGAVYFDGVNDGINLTSHADINLSSQTQRSIELWFNADDLDGRQVIYEEGGGSNGINLYLDGDRLNFGIWAGGKRKWLDHGIEANTTYHAVLVFDQGQLTAYVNGQAVGQVATGFSALPSHGDPAGIAKTYGGTLFADHTVGAADSYYFQGTIDDFSLYNDPLSADAIAQRYAVNLQSMAHWSLSETAGNQAVNEGTLGSEVGGTYIGAPDLDAEGLVAEGDGAVYFDGINDGVNLSSHAEINVGNHAQRTVELWFKAEDLDGRQVIYEEGGGGNGINLYLDGDRLNFGTWAGGNRGWLNQDVEANTTYHAVLVFDQGQLSAYINGESIGQVETGFSVLPVHGNGVGIAKTHGNTRFADNTHSAYEANHFHGTVDDLSLYNDALSADAIAHRYASQAPEENSSGITGKTLQNIQYRNLERLDGARLTTGSATALTEDGNATITVLNPGDTAQITHINGQEVSADATVTIASGAEVTVNANGTLAYDTAGRFASLSVDDVNQDFFTYSTLDENGVSNTATIRLNVTGVNAGPVGNDDQATTLENGTVTFSALKNDTDIDLNDVLRITQVDGQGIAAGATKTLASGAKVTLNSDGTFSYDPNSQFESLGVGQTAQDSFSYTVSDGNGGTETATVTLTIQGQNDGPVAVADQVVLAYENLTKTINVLGNDQDIDQNDLLSITQVNGEQLTVGSTVELASGAKLTFNANGTFTYRPNGRFEHLSVGQTAQDSFSYTIRDRQGNTSVATVSFTINGTNDGPVARNDRATLAEDQIQTINVLNNDFDRDQGDTFGITHVNGQALNAGGTITLASGAKVKLNADGTFAYDSNRAFADLVTGQRGTDSFTYTIRDSQGATRTATVTLTINGIDGFKARTGSSNPFNGIDVGNNSSPTFADLDGDGDQDLFVTDGSGTIEYYHNDNGTFRRITGDNNPLNGIGGQDLSFADIDKDGDLDAFVSDSKGMIHYYRNDNNSFRQVTGSANPFNGVQSAMSAPKFADIDGDGDLDAFITRSVDSHYQIDYYRNTNRRFSQVTGNANPFHAQSFNSQYVQPGFADIDQDGDTDAFLGSAKGVMYSENRNGSSFSGAQNQASSANPFSQTGDSTSGAQAITFVDLDGDGDLDSVIGKEDGKLYFFENM